MIVMATDVHLVFFVAVTAYILAACIDLHQWLHSDWYLQHTHRHKLIQIQCDLWEICNICICTVCGEMSFLLFILFIFYCFMWKQKQETLVVCVCLCFCSHMTTVILSSTPLSCSNSSSTMIQLLSCSPMQTRRATSCSGQCLWVYMFTWWLEEKRATVCIIFWFCQYFTSPQTTVSEYFLLC